MTPESEPLPQSPHLGVSAVPAEDRVAPGETAIFAITIENRKDEAQSQSIELQGLPEEWFTIDFDERRVTFPREQRSATLVVSVPEDAEASRHRFRVLVRANGEESAVQCSLEVQAKAAPSPEPPQPKAEAPPPPVVSLAPALVTWQGGAGEEERLTITVRNVGPKEAEYSVSLEGLAAEWYALPPKLRVPAGQALDAQLRIRPPARTKSGDYPLKVRVALDAHPDIAAEAQGQLTVAARAAAERRPPPRRPAEPAKASSTPILPPDVSLAPRTTFHFGPGEVSAQAILTIQNKSRLIERYQIEVEGIDDDWYRLATFELNLDPGASQQMPLTLTPRTGPGKPAGQYPFRVRVAPHRFPDSFAEVGGIITIAGVPAFDARLTPAQIQGRKEIVKLILKNTGSVPLNLIIEGSDIEGMCKFKYPPAPNLDPGEEAVVPVWVGARRNGLLGSPEPFAFRLKVMPAGAESTAAKSFDAQFIHQPFLSHRFAFITLFLALLVSIVGIIIALGPPRVADGFTWIGCQMDDDYQKVKGGPVFIKEECGGAPESVQERSLTGVTGTATPTPTPTGSPAASPTGTAGASPTTPPSGECVSALAISNGSTVKSLPSVGVRVRKDPSIEAPRLDNLKQGQTALVIGGPTCTEDGLTWWNIERDSLIGWVAEADQQGEALLEPQ